MRDSPPEASSRPVCMEPMSTRFFSLVKPRSRGENISG